MAIISTTMCYPHAAAPTQGIFVRHRLREIARHLPLAVIAPVPWFPILRPKRVPFKGANQENPPVWRPRMFCIPGIRKSADDLLYAGAMAHGISGAGLKGNIRVIDAHFEWPDGVGACVVAKELRVPFVCTLRGKLVSQIQFRDRRKSIIRMLNEADALISVSQSLADLAREVAGRDLTIHVVPNGVDTANFFRFEDDRPPHPPSESSRRELGWSSDARYAVSVGHVQRLKGWHRLIEAWPAVRQQAGDIRLVLVGGGARERRYEIELRQSINKNAVTESVQFMGRVEPDAVAKLLNAADLYVHASQSEGWCNAIAEALACGCPVVATDVGGNRELVNTEALGTLVELDDRDALVDAIVRGLSHEWDRTQIAQVGGRRDWQQVGLECVDVLKDVMARGRRSTP